MTTINLLQGDNNIDVQHLPKGIYVVVVEDNSNVIAKKVLKN